MGCHLWGCTESDTTEVTQQQQQQQCETVMLTNKCQKVPQSLVLIASIQEEVRKQRGGNLDGDEKALQKTPIH